MAGFTLIETLVALAVLATAAVALIGAAEAHVGRIAGLEKRAAAGWVADSALAEAMLGLSPGSRPAPMFGYAFDLEYLQEPTGDPDLVRLTVSVHDRADQRVVARLTGFVLRPWSDEADR